MSQAALKIPAVSGKEAFFSAILMAAAFSPAFLKTKP